MTITDDAETMVDRLLALPVTDLVLHEEIEPVRLQKVARNLSRNGILKNPVLATRLPDQRWLIIDGAHRANALRRIGVDCALVQVIPAGGYSIAAWHHLVNASRIAPALERLLVDRCPWCDPDEAQVPRGVCVAAVHRGRRVRHAWSGSTDVAGAADLMSRVFACYSRTGHYRRVPAEERDRRPGDQRQVRVAYRPWTLAALCELTARQLLLPAGVTRFVVPGRVLGADVSLASLCTMDGGARLRGELEARNFRYYAEPVYIAE